MKYFLSKFFCLISVFSFAQKTLIIEYKQEHVGEKDVYTHSVNGVAQTFNIELSKVRMLLNDSFAQIHYFRNGYDPIRKKTKQVGDKLIHHGYFYDFINKEYYSQCNLDKTIKNLVPLDTTQYKSWNILDMQKIILGYTCKAALSINEKNDSTLVWFTNDLQFDNGFLFYYGVPGVVLESYDQRFKNTTHFLAVKIEETDIELLRPTEGKIISRKDFSEIMKVRNEKMGGNYFIKIKPTQVN